MTKARPALASVPLLTARGLLSLVLGACAFPQNARPPDTLNPSLFQLQHTSWTERDGAPPAINGIAQAPDGSLWLGSGEGRIRDSTSLYTESWRYAPSLEEARTLTNPPTSVNSRIASEKVTMVTFNFVDII